MPNDFEITKNRYHEPFVGGGALFFSVSNTFSLLTEKVKRRDGKRFFISDSNAELVNFYRVVRDEPEKLIRSATRLAKSRNKVAFYRVRQSKPTTEVSRAARFLYLNRLCFNGLYRVNSRGEFNVPFGNYRNPVIVNKEQIYACSLALSHASIKKTHFRSVLARAQRGDLVYLDPPYIPVSKTASFSQYVKEDFVERDQRELAEVIGGLTANGVRVILSNSDTTLSRSIFAKLSLFSVPASRAISASSNSRGKVHELVGVNFDLSEMKAAEQVRGLRVA